MTVAVTIFLPELMAVTRSVMARQEYAVRLKLRTIPATMTAHGNALYMACGERAHQVTVTAKHITCRKPHWFIEFGMSPSTSNWLVNPSV